MIINATAAARSGGLPTLPTSLVGARTACVDLSYGEVAIPFLAWARAAGAHKVVDGVGMLVEQAADAFKLWHDVRQYTDEAHAALREHNATLATGDQQPRFAIRGAAEPVASSWAAAGKAHVCCRSSYRRATTAAPAPRTQPLPEP